MISGCSAKEEALLGVFKKGQDLPDHIHPLLRKQLAAVITGDCAVRKGNGKADRKPVQSVAVVIGKIGPASHIAFFQDTVQVLIKGGIHPVRLSLCLFIPGRLQRLRKPVIGKLNGIAVAKSSAAPGIRQAEYIGRWPLRLQKKNCGGTGSKGCRDP